MERNSLPLTQTSEFAETAPQHNGDRAQDVAPTPVEFDLASVTIEELEAALHERQAKRLVELRERRSELLDDLRRIEAELAAAENAAGIPRAPTSVVEDPKANLVASPSRSSMRIGTVVLKALAARYPGQATVADLATELRSHVGDEGAESTLRRVLGKFRSSGLVWSSEGESYTLTPSGLDRAGGG